MKKILIADELSYSRELLSFALTHNGYEVITADDGPSAIDALRKKKPDLVILDSRLPKIDGLSVLRAARAIPQFKSLPVFLLNAGENRQHILQAIQIGVQEYILKSQFDLKTLLSRIKKCLGAREPMAAPAAPPMVEEVWDEVDVPANTGGASIEIEGDMEAALSSKKSR